MLAPAGTKSRDVSLTVTSTKLKLTVRGELILDGELHARVIADECTYSIEDRADGRVVTLMLLKAIPTTAWQHWSCVVVGEPQIDVKKFGAPIRSFNPNDTTGLRTFFDK